MRRCVNRPSQTGAGIVCSHGDLAVVVADAFGCGTEELVGRAVYVPEGLAPFPRKTRRKIGPLHGSAMTNSATAFTTMRSGSASRVYTCPRI